MQHETPPQFAAYPRHPMNGPNPVGVETIATAIQVFTHKPAPWIVASIPLTVLSAVFQVVNYLPGRALKGREGDLGLVFGVLGGQMLVAVVYALAYYVMFGGMTRMANKALAGEVVTAKDAFDLRGRDVLQGMIATLLVGVAYCVGFAACFVPGLMVYGFAMIVGPLVFVGKRSGADAIVESFQLMKPYLWSAVGIHLLLGIISMFGASFCFIGQLVTLPIYALAVTLVYRRLTVPEPAATA